MSRLNILERNVSQNYFRYFRYYYSRCFSAEPLWYEHNPPCSCTHWQRSWNKIAQIQMEIQQNFTNTMLICSLLCKKCCAVLTLTKDFLRRRWWREPHGRLHRCHPWTSQPSLQIVIFASLWEWDMYEIMLQFWISTKSLKNYDLVTTFGYLPNLLKIMIMLQFWISTKSLDGGEYFAIGGSRRTRMKGAWKKSHLRWM